MNLFDDTSSNGANQEAGKASDNDRTNQQNSPKNDGSFQKEIKQDEAVLAKDIDHLRKEGDAGHHAIQQLKEIEDALRSAEKTQNPEELKKATEELKQYEANQGDGGGSGGDGGGSGNGGSGKGSGGDGGGSGSGGGGNGSGGVGSNETTFGTSSMPTVDQSAPGFYVSANGSANGNGTKEDPFATLQQAQQAMEHSNIKTTYVEGGTYQMSSTLKLTSADSGESFISVGGASNPAVLDGGGNLSNLISLDHANNVNIEGFSMENTSNAPIWGNKHGQVASNVGAIYAEDSSGDNFSSNSMNNVNLGINMQGDSNTNVARNSITDAQSAIDSGSDQNNVYGSDNTIQGNLVENITGYGAKLFDNVGAINIYGDTDSTVDDNVIQNTAGVGIQENFSQNGSGFNISNNTILNTDYDATPARADTSSNPVGDDGSIHIIVQPGSTKQLNGVIDNNYIDGAGDNVADKCIYLDDGVNGVTVNGNFLNEGGPGYAMQVHGGSDNTLSDNTIDLGNGKGILYQTDGFVMSNNAIDGNDFIITGIGTKAYEFMDTDSADMPTFSDNDYSTGVDQSPDPNGTTD